MLLLYRGESFDADFFYHAGVDIDHAFFVSDGPRRTLLVPKMNEGIARATFKGRVVPYDDPLKALSGLIGRRSVQCDAASLSYRMGTRLGKMCRLKDNAVELLKQRARKKPQEVADIRKAVRLTKEILDSLDIKAARTELDLQKQIAVLTAEMGLEQAFEPIVATDNGSSYPHYRAGRRKLGSLVLVDYGVRWNHYCADLTRVFLLKPDRKKKEQYESLQNICGSIVDELPSLHRGKDVAALSARLMKEAGFPELIHSIGHGVGLEIHEFPRLGMKSGDPVAKSVIAIEPAFYLPKRYGMRYEETVWFDGKRARVL